MMPKTTTILAAAFALTVMAWIWMKLTYAPSWWTPGHSFLNAALVVKAAMTFSFLSGLAGVGLALARLRPAALSLAWTAIGWGVLGALYGEATTQIALREVSHVRFGITALARMEALACLALGTGLALIAMAISDLRKAR